MEREISDATKLLSSIQGHVLVSRCYFEECHGIVFITVTHAGALLSIRAGNGIVLSHKNGTWSQPVAVNFNGEIGLEKMVGSETKTIIVFLMKQPVTLDSHQPGIRDYIQTITSKLLPVVSAANKERFGSTIAIDCTGDTVNSVSFDPSGVLSSRQDRNDAVYGPERCAQDILDMKATEREISESDNSFFLRRKLRELAGDQVESREMYMH